MPALLTRRKHRIAKSNNPQKFGMILRYIRFGNQIEQKQLRLCKIAIFRVAAIERPHKGVPTQLTVNAGRIIAEEAVNSKVRDKRKAFI